MNKKPCTTVMKKDAHLEPGESRKECYIMVGQQIKYEPAFVSNKIHKKALMYSSVDNGRRSLT